MRTDKLLERVAEFIPAGEAARAAVKVTPRGAAHEVILGGAGAVAGGTVGPAFWGAGAVAGSAAASGPGDAGREEREAADLDVGRATQALLVATDQAVLLFALTGFGRPRDLTARLDRKLIAGVRSGEAKLFGQKMMEIVITTTSGAEAGFGVAKVHRKDGDAVLAVLAVGGDSA